MTALRALLDSFKKEHVLLGPVQRYLLAQQEFGDDRRSDVLHPSELVSAEVCPRALFYRLSGWAIPRETTAFQLEVIFAAGHGYHAKWQDWAWGAGMLRGRYRCLACGWGDWSRPEIADRWVATSPDHCSRCGASRYHLQYGEVPIALPKYGIAGKADGDLDLDPTDDPLGVPSDPLLEIKSVGEGTVRMAAPALIARHTKRVLVDDAERTWTDWTSLWRDIRRPFRAHVKQATLYCLAAGRESMLFVYEFKPTGAVKEFSVEADPTVVEEELDLALDVLYAVKRGRAPGCPHGGCPKCKAFEEARDGARDEAQDTRSGGEDPDAGTGSRARSAQRDGTPNASEGRVPRVGGRRRLRRVERP